MKKYLLVLLTGCLLLTACQSQKEEKPPEPLAEPDKATISQTTETAKEEITEPAKEEVETSPPTPPLFENFQASPQLSLFPRAGAFRPDDDDEKGLAFWRTYIDHLIRTSGPIKTDEKEDANVVFGLRAVKGIDSVGVFSPLSVTPNTTYQVSANISCDLVEGATAGIGLLEFDLFMWIGSQYTEVIAKDHQVGSQTGVTLTGQVKDQEQKFTFTTGPNTEMIHLLFFRDGEHDRNPVTIDNVEIKAAE